MVDAREPHNGHQRSAPSSRHINTSPASQSPHVRTARKNQKPSAVRRSSKSTNTPQRSLQHDNEYVSSEGDVSTRPAQTGRTLRTAAQLERIRAEGAQRRAAHETSEASSARPGQVSTHNPDVKDHVSAAVPTSIHRAQKRRSLVSNNPAQISAAVPQSKDKTPEKRPSVNASKPSVRAQHTNRGNMSAAEIGQARLERQVWTKSDTTYSMGQSSVPTTRNAKAQRRAGKASVSLGKAGGFSRNRGSTKRGGFKRVIACVAAIALVIGLFGVIDNALHDNKIYEGVYIGDIDLSNKTIDEATQLLTDEYAQRVASNTAVFFTSEQARKDADNSEQHESIQEQISYEESLSNRTEWTVPASAVKAILDVDALVQQAYDVGRAQGGLFARLQARFQGWQVDVVCSFDDTLFEELRTSLTESIGTMRVNYDVDLKDGIASVTEGHAGNEVTSEWLAQRLNETFLGSVERNTYIIETQEAPLQVSEEQAQSVADSINASIAEGIEFTYEDQSWKVERADLAQWVITSLEEDGDSWLLKPAFDADALKAALFKNLNSSINQKDIQVTFEKEGESSITVMTNATGTIPLVSDVIDSLNQSFFVTEFRTETPTYALESTEIPSSLSFKDAQALGIVSEISTYTTQYSSEAEARRNNIHTAADYLNYSLAKANGGTWSFNSIAGEATEERGYQNAGAIVGGVYSDAIGGGICQVATTIFNAVYDSGFPITERHNHSLHISSYPKGRDAAIAYPTYDLVWENDSDSDVLLVMSYTNSSLTATLWGVDPGYQVSTEYGDWEEGEAYSTKYRVDDSLEPGTQYVETTGVNGVSVTIVRTVKDKDGATLHEDTFSSTYAPKNEVIVKSAE